MHRLALAFAILTVGAPARADSQADLAAKLVEEGKQLMYASKYREASAKFQQAVARVPDPRYYFNLCTSLFQEGKFAEAIVACDAATRNEASAELVAKTEKLVEKIRSEAKTQGISLQPRAGTPPPGAQAEIAKKLAEEAKQLIVARKFAEASAKLRLAIARVPEPGYFFDLCVALSSDGKLADALTACDAAAKSPPLAAKVATLMQKIRDEARRQGIALAPPPPPGTQADIAKKLVEEGKQLMYAGNYAAATAKFQQAVARVPEPAYLFDLCMSMFQEGKFGEASVACEAAAKSAPKELATKVEALAQKIRDEAKKQGVALPKK